MLTSIVIGKNYNVRTQTVVKSLLALSDTKYSENRKTALQMFIFLFIPHKKHSSCQ